MTSDLGRAARGWLVAAAVLAGCHEEAERLSLVEPPITLRDRWLDVSTEDGRSVVVTGDLGKIVRSDDGGETWSVVESPTDRALTRLAFADGRRGWAVGQDGVVLRTIDGGRSWRAQESGTTSHLFGLAAIDGDTAFACGDRSAWLTTRDGGDTWSAGTIPLSDVGLDPAIALAVEEPIYYDVTFVDRETGWVVGDYGNIRVTRDGGRTWGARHGSLLGQTMPGGRRPLRDALDLPALFRVGMDAAGRGLAVGVGGIVLETADGGERWTLGTTAVVPPVEAPLLAVRAGAAGTLLFGGSGTALLSDGAGWRRLDLGLPLLTWLAAADFARSGPLAGRRGFAVGGRGVILRTEDGGASWQPVGGPGARP